MEVSYNSELAKNALEKAITANQSMIDEFKRIMNSMETNFASGGGAVGGRAGEAMGNSFVNSTGDQFVNIVQEKTKDFLENTVPAIIKKYDSITDKTTSVYSHTN